MRAPPQCGHSYPQTAPPSGPCPRSFHKLAIVTVEMANVPNNGLIFHHHEDVLALGIEDVALVKIVPSIRVDLDRVPMNLDVTSKIFLGMIVYNRIP